MMKDVMGVGLIEIDFGKPNDAVTVSGHFFLYSLYLRNQCHNLEKSCESLRVR